MAKNTKQDSISLTLRKEWKSYGLRASDITVNGAKLNHAKKVRKKANHVK